MMRVIAIFNIAENLIDGYFTKRINRFLGKVYVDGQKLDVYIPNSGRMAELLVSDASVKICSVIEKSNRKTKFDLISVLYRDVWVSIDSRVPNRFFKYLIQNNLLPDFNDWKINKEEFKFSNSRLDFLLQNKSKEDFLIELKSCTLVENGIALFPDAPTSRGVKHLNDLAKACKLGKKGGIVFLVQREDCECFSPNTKMDPVFAEALISAKEHGVKVFAYKCKLIEKQLKFIGKIPVVLDNKPSKC